MTDVPAVDVTAALRQIREWLRVADRVLIGAGAGMSAPAGLDCSDPAAFARVFPALARQGFRTQYDLVGHDGWSPAQKWGYLATLVQHVRFGPPEHPVYGALLDLIRGKDYFVLTSNADAMFVRNGFDERRLFTPQGDYGALQCLTPCWRRTWPSQPTIDRLLPVIDPGTLEVTDRDALPYCPNCGGEVYFNVRGGRWFLEDDYEPQGQAFVRWTREAMDEPMLAIEIGAGSHTPSVVRWPMEHLVQRNPMAWLVRINLAAPEVPVEIIHRSIALQGDAMSALAAIQRRY
jgi:NAD-dependent SIR2 family protein deacetylase